MNPKEYCQKHDIPYSDFITKAKEKASLFDGHLFICASNADYGVQLRESVARHIRGDKPERRKNPHRIQFRCTDSMKSRIINAMDICSCATIQEFMTLAVKVFLMQIEKAAATSRTGDSGNAKKIIDNISRT